MSLAQSGNTHNHNTDSRPAKSRPDPLTLEHQRMLYGGSAIAPDVAAARGYRSITSAADVPSEFASWQRRRGLLVPTYSPNGETVGYQLRPDKPIKRKSGNAPKYETPAGARITLDVNPLMLDEVRRGDDDLWITEGCKKVDALTSQGLPTVGIIGVWNFAEPGSKSTRPLSCWSHVWLRGRHVRLRGRRVYIVYDRDARTNPNVQEALRRLVAMLEKMGATVLVIYLPPVNGDGKAGVDDYLAAGGTVAELRERAGPYEPVDIGAERMGQDDRLRAGVADLMARWQELPGNGPGECSARDVAYPLVEAAPEGGKVVAGGVRVVMAWGTLMLKAKVSRRTLAKALARLEDIGFLYRDNAARSPRKSGQAGAFVLRANVDHYGRMQGQGEGQGPTSSERESGCGGLHLRAPRLRWSSPGSRPSRKTIGKYRRGEIARLPEPRLAIKRLGKIRGALLDVLDLAGGSATLQEIADALQRKRARDIRRRLLPWLVEDGIVTVCEAGDRVSLTADWQERLGLAMWAAGEQEADERDRSALKLRREVFHYRRKRRPTPTPRASVEAIERSHRRREAGMHAQARPVSELSRPPEPDPEIVEALRSALIRWPDHGDDYASWWASTLHVEDYLPYKPTREQVEVALYELAAVAA
jgi:uncharacterized protein DUF3854